MKTFKELVEGLVEAWPGTPEYKKKFGDSSASDSSKSGTKHNISTKDGVTKVTRKYDPKSGESEEATVKNDGSGEAPVKRGRGRPPGKYGSYKKKIKESIEFMETLDEEQVAMYLETLDEETLDELEMALSEDDEETPLVELTSNTLKSYKAKSEIAGKQHVKTAHNMFHGAGPDEDDKATKLGRRHMFKALQRGAGQSRAEEKLAKRNEEVETQIDEVGDAASFITKQAKEL